MMISVLIYSYRNCLFAKYRHIFWKRFFLMCPIIIYHQYICHIKTFFVMKCFQIKFKTNVERRNIWRTVNHTCQLIQNVTNNNLIYEMFHKYNRISIQCMLHILGLESSEIIRFFISYVMICGKAGTVN